MFPPVARLPAFTAPATVKEPDRLSFPPEIFVAFRRGVVTEVVPCKRGVFTY